MNKEDVAKFLSNMDVEDIKSLLEKRGLRVIDARREVRDFAELMERKLRANDHKPGWKKDSAAELYKRLVEESAELRLEIGMQGSSADRESLGNEAADVANFAMMIADVSGVFGEETAAAKEDGAKPRRPLVARWEKIGDKYSRLIVGHFRIDVDKVHKFTYWVSNVYFKSRLEHSFSTNATDAVQMAVDMVKSTIEAVGGDVIIEGEP